MLWRIFVDELSREHMHVRGLSRRNCIERDVLDSLCTTHVVLPGRTLEFLRRIFTRMLI